MINHQLGGAVRGHFSRLGNRHNFSTRGKFYHYQGTGREKEGGGRKEEGGGKRMAGGKRRGEGDGSC